MNTPQNRLLLGDKSIQKTYLTELNEMVRKDILPLVRK